MNVDVMDGLDWAIVISAIGVYCLLIGRFFSGIDVLGVADTPPWKIGPNLGIANLFFFIGADHLVPMKTIVYAVNGGQSPIETGVGDESFCLPARSYTVLTSRWDASHPLAARSADRTADDTYPVGRGMWLVNVSQTTVYAELTRPAKGGYSTGTSDIALPAKEVVHGSIGDWQIRRLDFDPPADRSWSSEGGIAKQVANGLCSAVQLNRRPPP